MGGGGEGEGVVGVKGEGRGGVRRCVRGVAGGVREVSGLNVLLLLLLLLTMMIICGGGS